jgi:hypothetical protein
MTVVENTANPASVEAVAGAVAVDAASTASASELYLSSLLAGKCGGESVPNAVDEVDEDDDGVDNGVDYDVGPVLPCFVTEPYWFLHKHAGEAWNAFEPAEDDATEEEVCAKRCVQQSAAKKLVVALVFLSVACIRSETLNLNQQAVTALFPDLTGFDGCDTSAEWCRAARSEFLLRQLNVDLDVAAVDARRTAHVVGSLLSAWKNLDLAIEGDKTAAETAETLPDEMTLIEAAAHLHKMTLQMRARLHDAASPSSSSEFSEEATASLDEDDAGGETFHHDDIDVLPALKYVVRQVVSVGVDVVSTVHDALNDVTGDLD